MGVEVVSLGCRLNLSESESLRGLLSESDDLVVINSCAVTQEAVRQTRQAIRRARARRPLARLLVTGCAADIEAETIGAMPEVDGLVANTLKLEAHAYGATLPPALPKLHTESHTRAFVQVQNGCDHSCTFCVIPQGRGANRSHSVASVLSDIATHLDSGAKEVVLTGVDVTSWGMDLSGTPSLGSLVQAILDAFPQLNRLRLSSLDGVAIDPHLEDLITSEPRIMPHLHLSLQHGDDLILKRMKRRHSRADAIALVSRIKTRRPEVALGADLIAGFPTESDAAHAANLSIIEELDIVHGHIFPYSPRPGTPAARMPQLDRNMIKARAAQLREAVGHRHQVWQNGLIGQQMNVLAERDGTGHAHNFARVGLPTGTKAGTLVAFTPTCVKEGLLL